MKTTKQCYGCKQQFLTNELVEYASPNAKLMHSYCHNCLIEKQNRDKFSNKVCSIFGIKTPGPRIWAERKRLQNTYGYTDQVIVDCLDYIYNVENMKKLSESLCLIKPDTVNRMMAYKKRMAYEATKMAQAMSTEQVEYIVPIKESKNVQKIKMNPDEWLDD